MIKILILDHPKNESKEHYELKQIAKLICKIKGCQVIAEEVSGFRDVKLYPHKKGIVDVGGIKIVNKNMKELPEIFTYAFESKASLADYRNGFNAGADYTYVIAPKGIIPVDEIPNGIGFYEVDLDNYKINHQKIKSGIVLVRKASRRNKGKHYRTKFMTMLEVARRATNIDLYNHCQIKICK